jgi:hypothetical protein
VCSLIVQTFSFVQFFHSKRSFSFSPKDEEILYLGTKLLNNIATTSRGKALLVAFNIYDVMLHCLRVQKESIRVVNTACSVLLQLIYNGSTFSD